MQAFNLRTNIQQKHNVVVVIVMPNTANAQWFGWFLNHLIGISSLSLEHFSSHTPFLLDCVYYKVYTQRIHSIELFSRFYNSIFHEQFFGLQIILLFEVNIECIKFIFEIMSVRGLSICQHFMDCMAYDIRYIISYWCEWYDLHSNLVMHWKHWKQWTLHNGQFVLKLTHLKWNKDHRPYCTFLLLLLVNL